MSYEEIITRTVASSQSKWRIEEIDRNQQNSYNLSLESMKCLLEKGAIKLTTDNHYELSDDYKLILGNGILDLIGDTNGDELGIIFVYTLSETENNTTEKFQIKRTENLQGKYQWFSKLYDKNYEGSRFVIFLDKDNKLLKFDSLPPVDMNTYNLVDLSDENECIEYLSDKLKAYNDDEALPKPIGVILFGMDYCQYFTNHKGFDKKVVLKALPERESLQKELHKGVLIANALRTRDKNLNTSVTKLNKIYYGIPGCGKSFHIEHHVLKNVPKENVFRTTFYLDYTNSDFIGQIYPDTSNEEKVKYKPIPGPFTRALEKAYRNREENVYLVIEEINRGNAAAIFGDTFQLLDRILSLSADRTEDGRIVGDSEYPINNEFIDDYFEKVHNDSSGGKKTFNYTKGQKIYIPHNLILLATMNTSDQNVFPLDTAFKRRWDMERVNVEWEKVDSNFKNMYIPFTNYTWEDFASKVNGAMIKKDVDGTIMEDKQLGPYFIDKSLLVSKDDKASKTEDNKEKLKMFVNNVLDYLYNDATKFNHEILFEKDLTFDKIYKKVNDYFTKDDLTKNNLCLTVLSNNEVNNQANVEEATEDADEQD